MFSSIDCVIVSVVLVIASHTAACQALSNSDGNYENDICSAYPYSVCRRITSCPTAIQDILCGRDLTVCGFGDNEPKVCCALRRKQSETYGLWWDSFGRAQSRPNTQWGSSGRQPTNTQEPSWNQFGHVQSYTQGLSWSPQPLLTLSPLGSVTSYSQDQFWDSSGRKPSGTWDVSLRPLGSSSGTIQQQQWNSSEPESTDIRGLWPWTSWTPFVYIPRQRSEYEPVGTRNRDPPQHFPPIVDQPVTQPQLRNKEFSGPETTTKASKSSEIPTYTPPPPIPGIENTLAVKKCQEYGQFCTRVKDYVAGGVVAEPRELPHMALIGFGPENAKSWQCGGSVISTRYILSAAHCTYPGELVGYAKWVRLGDVDYTTFTNGVKPNEYTIIEWINHPEYIPPQMYNDIALYKVDKEIVFTDFIQPICLQTSFSISETIGKAAGWGRIEFVGPTSNHLMYTNISIVNPEECKDSLDNRLSKSLFPDGVATDRVICAGEDDGSHDTFQGDSGGPLFVTQKDPWPFCLYKQVGITSAGLPCKQKHSPGLYTRVSNYVPWIESIVWANDP